MVTPLTSNENWPEGLKLIADFANAERRADLLRAVDARPWRSDLRRRVQHYGWRYDYRARRVSPGDRLGPLPDWLGAELDRLERVFPTRPDQVIVNEYEPGQGIAAHVDCQPCFGDVVASLSLCGACVMAFREPASGAHVPVLLRPGALLVMQGAARHRWTHAIAARKSDVIDGRREPRERRVSLTFRTVTLTDD